MPLLKIPGPEAIEIRKANGFAKWPGRSATENRVEPVALPDFKVGFALKPGEPIFTIGSCFARNIELRLMERGFPVPMRDLLDQPEFKGLHASALNNYGVTSIWQELSWAFAEEFDHRRHFVEALPGRFVDLNLSSKLTRPEPLEDLLARRKAIIECTRLIRECRVVVITLGLAEVWWDNVGKAYLNEMPRPTLLKKEPGRFELHVLDAGEAATYLNKALELIKENGRVGVQVILTVSPVPLTATHRPEDVMVANTYSKSVLRVAAEQARLKFDFVHYFPSYESVMLSDRAVTWEEDQIHVTDFIVDQNVKRMLIAYGAIEGEAATNVEQLSNLFKETANAGGTQQWRLLMDNVKLVQKDPTLSLELARLSARRKSIDGIKSALAGLPEKVPPYHRELFAAEMYFLMRNTAKCLRQLQIVETLEVSPAESKAVQVEVWRLKTLAYVQSGDKDRAMASVKMWQALYGHRAFILSARAFRDVGWTEEAVRQFASIRDRYRANTPVMLEYAELLVQLRRVEDARDILNGLGDQKDSEKAKAERLRLQLDPQKVA